MGPNDKDRTSLGYAGAIGVSAVAHAVLLYLMFFVLPRWFKPDETPPPAYTVAIVDNIPAGDLGTHPLPPLSGKHHKSARNPAPEERAEEKPPPKSGSNKIEAPDTDRNAIALNSVYPTQVATPEPTPTPPPPVQTPEPTAEPTAAPTQAASARPTARPTHRPRPTMRPQPTPRPRGEARERNKRKPPAPKIKPKIMLAAAKPIPHAMHTPSVKERLAMLRKRLMEEHLKQLARTEAASKEADTGEDTGDETDSGATTTASREERGRGGGPVAGSAATGGRGYGVGPGTGSAGILKDPEFLLYYQKVQERIKNAWSFGGGSKDLTTTVNFAIAPDGRLLGLEVAHSSDNTSFDQSVLRAIRGAAPFPPPPQRYRDQFAQGVQAVFQLGELSS